jgi:hypothetical protein
MEKNIVLTILKKLCVFFAILFATNLNLSAGFEASCQNFPNLRKFWNFFGIHLHSYIDYHFDEDQLNLLDLVGDENCNLNLIENGFIVLSFPDQKSLLNSNSCYVWYECCYCRGL